MIKLVDKTCMGRSLLGGVIKEEVLGLRNREDVWEGQRKMIDLHYHQPKTQLRTGQSKTCIELLNTYHI